MYSKTNLSKLFPVSCLVLFLAFTLVAPSQANALTINVRSSLGTNLSGIKVYAFTASNAYTGKASTTDTFGAAVFNAADFTPGEYKFRCDYLRGQFFSDLAQLPNDTNLDVVINEVLVTTAVDNGAGLMSGIKVYLFNENGAYLGKSATTDGSGEASFLVPADMPIKFRADVLGYQFWSPVQNSSVAHFPISLPHREVAVTVNGVNQFSQALGGLKTYLFTKSGAYMGISQTTDTGGEVRFNLPEKAYKVRVDHLGQQYWSEVFTWDDQTVDIPYGDASVTVSGNGAAIPGVKVYVFTAAGKYLNVYGITDSLGNVGFSLPEGAYDFRADFQNSQFWADNTDILAHQSNSVGISTGGGTFTFRVQKDSQTPIAGINCYVFTPAGVYLGMAGTTNSDGQVDFDLSDGQYKIRSDYLGYQYWSDDFAMPEDEAMVFKSRTMMLP